jgi:uncharacterized protein YndB with AHSA1/START domain
MVEVDAPPERVFDLLSDFESYPRWMGNVRGVWRVGRRETHWVVCTALDLDVEWDAEVTVFEPDRRVVWRAVRGDIHADGEFVLAETPEGTTLVRLILGYETPAGRTGRSAARFFGRHPRHQLEEDLARFKRFAERAVGARRRASRPREGREEFERRGDGGRRFEEGRAPRASGALREGRPRGESRPAYALTPRERERERESLRAEEEHRQRLRAGWYLRRGVDRLLDEPPPGRVRGEKR